MKRPFAYALVGACLLLSTMGPAAGYTRPGNTERITVGPLGVEARGTIHDSGSSISDDGRYVAFESNDPTLVEIDDKLAVDVFVFDRLKKEMELISVSSEGIPAVTFEPDDPFEDVHLGWADDPSISASGRFVVFTSSAPNLVPGDTNELADIFLRDRKLGATTRVSVSSSGEQAAEGECADKCPGNIDPHISASGRYLVFESDSPNLVENDTNGIGDVFIRDLKTGVTELVSTDIKGRGEKASAGCPSISDDGRYVVFGSGATDTASGPVRPETFLRDRAKRTTEIVSLTASGGRSDGPLGSGSGSVCGDVAISGDGRFIAFRYLSTLMPSDANTPLALDAYVHDRVTHRTVRVSLNSFGEETEKGGVDSGGGLSISPDGRFLGFTSRANDLVDGDTVADCEPLPLVVLPGDCAGLAGDSDVFVHDLWTGSTELVSMDSRGEQGAACASTDEDQVSLGYRAEFLSFSSCSSSLVEDDTNQMWDVFARHRGIPLGVGTLEGNSGVSDPEEGCLAGVCIPPTCIGSVCVPPGTPLSVADRSEVSALAPGMDIIEARIVGRPQHADLFTVLELDNLPLIDGLNPVLLLGLRFRVEGERYEVRATPLAGGTFGLFRCRLPGLCEKVGDLRGGFGTTGLRVVFSVPLDRVGLHDGGALRDVEAFSAVGSSLSGAAKTVDLLRLDLERS